VKSLRFVFAVFALCSLLNGPVASQSDPAVHISRPSQTVEVQNLPAGVSSEVVASTKTTPLSFAKPAAYSSGGNGPDSVAIADLKGNGKLDLVVANGATSTVGVLVGNGDGTFEAPATYGSGGSEPLAVAIGDVNGDGIPDLIVTNAFPTGSQGGDSEVSVMLGNGDGTFGSPVSYDSGGYYPHSVAVGDLNGDGHLDIVVVNTFPSFYSNSNGVVAVLMGNGDGTFQAPVLYESGGFSAVSIALGDVNGDGIPDLVVANQGTCETCANSSVGILLGAGDGSFYPAITYISGPAESFSVVIGDLNGDGYPDLAVSTECAETGTCGGGGVNVLMGNGNGTFQAPVTYDSGGAGPLALVAADVNGDGFLDLVVAECGINSCSGFGDVGVLLGNGDGTFQTAFNYGSGGGYSTSVAVADLNGDGRPDVVAANNNGGNVGVLLNNTVPAKTTLTLTSSPNPSQVDQSVTFIATLASTRAIPNGSTVTFAHGKTVLGTGTTTKGVASLTTSFLHANTYGIKAGYSGDVFHKASSGAIKQVVNR
jgi:hypothetical protein